MATNVGELEATLRLRDELSARLKEVDANLAKSGQSFETVGAKAKTFGGTTDSLIGSLTRIGAAFGVAFSAQAVIGAIQNVAELGSEITDMSVRTGIGVEELQKLGAVAEANGSSMEELGNAIQGMARKIAGGNDAAVTAVRMLGLEVKDLVAMNPDQAFLTIADAAAKIHNPMERTALLTDLGGKAFERLSPTIANVRTELEDVTTYIDKDTVAALDKFDDKTKEFGRAWDVFLAKFALPIVQEATAGLDWLIGKFADLRAAQIKAGDQEAIAALSRGPAAFAAYQAAVKDTHRDIELVNDAAAKMGPQIDASTLSVNRATAMLRLLREDAVFPLTDAQKQLIVELDAAGASLNKIAEAIGAPDMAIKNYLKSVDEGTKKQKEMAESARELTERNNELRASIEALNFMKSIPSLGAKLGPEELPQVTTPGAEYAALPADQLGQVQALDAAYAQLQTRLAALTPLSVNAGVESAAAWAQYNAEVLRLDDGMAGAITATDGMTASTGRLTHQFTQLRSAMQIPVPKDFDYSEAYKNNPLYKGYDISGGWAMQHQNEQERQKAIKASAMSGQWGGGTSSAVNVNVNATNSLILPSNQQSLGQIVSQAVIAQLKAQGVKVGSA